MKIYGWDDCGVARGELLAADVDAVDLDFGPQLVALEIGWESAYTSFNDAKRALIEAMVAESADADLIRQVRACKASYLPVV